MKVMAMIRLELTQRRFVQPTSQHAGGLKSTYADKQAKEEQQSAPVHTLQNMR